MIVTGFVFGQSFADFPRQIQPGKSGIFLLQLLDDAQALAIVLEAAVVFHQFVEDHLALWPKGECPRSCASAMVSARSSFSFSARAMLRAMAATSIVCVSRVRKWSPVPFRKTCVLYSSRRNARE